jgi:C1A family cysteine protease
MRRIFLTVLGFVFLVAVNGNAWSQEVNVSEISDYETLNASVMRPDLDTLMKWLRDYEETPEAFIDEEIQLRLRDLHALGLGTSLSLLGHLDYSPSARDQASCANCWVWASTGVVEIAHSVQNGVKNRLSTQFLNSCKTDKYACCGGTAEIFTDWYKGVGYVVPWSNTNAAFQDGTNKCSAGAPTVSCGNIATNPNYPLTAITTEQVPITGVTQSTAIANIKNVLNQNKAMYMGFFLPNQSDWDQFLSFWSGANAAEGNIWNPDFSCGHAYDNNGGGHAVLLVGYNDQDSNPNNHYWILLNSWGTASNKRPNGLFRMAMNVNYSCTYPVSGQTLDALRFNTLSPTFGCTYSISPTSNTVTGAGGTGSVAVTAGAGCAWSASTNPGSWDWVGITSGTSGTGNGTVNYIVLANNTGGTRTGTLIIAGQTFTLTQQSGGGCTYSISPTSNTVTGAGGTGSVAVTAGAGCAWSASTNPGSWDWVGITSGTSGTGNGTVNYIVLANNTGGTRTGTLTIAGRTFTITQQAGGGCTYSISPTGSTFAGGGGTGSVAVTAGAGCAWTASTTPGSWDWMGITSGSSGTGNGAVNYIVLANPSGQNRTGTLTIAGKTFTVTQGAH